MEKKKIQTLIIGQSTEPFAKENALIRVSDFLSEMSCDYPFFSKWLDKVFRETDTPQRCIVVCRSEDDNTLLGVAILKNTAEEKKICTLRVNKDYKQQGIGSILIDEAIKWLGESKPLITVPEDHISAFKPLLRKYKFQLCQKVKSVYRNGVFEYFFNAKCVQRIALLSIKPEYVKAIADGRKNVEFRKKVFNGNVDTVYIYSSSPVMKIVGYFIVEKIETGSPQSVWINNRDYAGITKEKYFRYFGGRTANAIHMKNVVWFKNCISLSEIETEYLHPPQNYCYLNNIRTISFLQQIETL